MVWLSRGRGCVNPKAARVPGLRHPRQVPPCHQRTRVVIPDPARLVCGRFTCRVTASRAGAAQGVSPARIQGCNRRPARHPASAIAMRARGNRPQGPAGSGTAPASDGKGQSDALS